jgi:hypothetical protein
LDELDMHSVCPRDPSAGTFAAEEGGFLSVPLSPAQNRRHFIRHIDATEYLLPVSPVCGANGSIVDEELASRNTHLLAIVKPSLNGSHVHERIEDAAEHMQLVRAFNNAPFFRCLPPKSTFSQIRAVDTQASTIEKRQLPIPDYNPEGDLMARVRHVVGEVPVGISAWAQKDFHSPLASSFPLSTVSQESIPLEVPPSKRVPLGEVATLVKNTTRFSVPQPKFQNTDQQGHCVEPSPEPFPDCRKTVGFWCLKHHSSRIGTARRMLLLCIGRSSICISVKHTDERKGCETPLKSNGQDPHSVELQRTEPPSVELLVGVAAYCHSSIHRTKVTCPAHCLVLSMHGKNILSVEFFSLAECEACVKFLKLVTG